MRNAIWFFGVLASTLSFAAEPLVFGPGVSEQLQQALLGDLQFVEKMELKAQTQRNQQIYGGASGAAYASWFRQRIAAVGYAGNAGPLAMAFVDTRRPNIMWLTSNFLEFPPPQAWRVGVLWHEARHSESTNSNWLHINCPAGMTDTKGQPLRSLLSGKLIGTFPGCDTTSLGAYGSAATLSGNIAAFCTNCSEKIKTDAQLFFGDGVNRQVSEEQRQELLRDFVKP